MLFCHFSSSSSFHLSRRPSWPCVTCQLTKKTACDDRADYPLAVWTQLNKDVVRSDVPKDKKQNISLANMLQIGWDHVFSVVTQVTQSDSDECPVNMDEGCLENSLSIAMVVAERSGNRLTHGLFGLCNINILMTLVLWSHPIASNMSYSCLVVETREG